MLYLIPIINVLVALRSLCVSTYIGMGFSKDLDAVKAAKDAADQAKLNLHSSNIDLAIVLNTAHYNPNDFLPSLFVQLKNPRLLGSSTAGIILGEHIETRGIAVLLLYSDEIRFESAMVDNLRLQDLKAGGQQLASSCLSDYGKEHRKLFLFFSDGLLQELSQFISGITQTFEGVFPIIGAGSSDDFHFKKTYQYYENTVLASGACAVLFGGRMQAALSCRHGFRPLGKPRLINDSEGNVIKSIDNKPAAEIYQEYFDTTTETLRASNLSYLNTRYPLGSPTGAGREYLLRNIINTLDDDSIVLQDTLAKGKTIHLMIGNKESCLQAAQSAAEDVKSQMQGRTPKLIFIFESLSRYRILGRSAHAEIQKVHEILGFNVPIFGMYSFGEISTYPSFDGPETFLQNESILIAAIS